MAAPWARGGPQPGRATRERAWVLDRTGHSGLWNAVLLRIGGAPDAGRLASAVAQVLGAPALAKAFAPAHGRLEARPADPVALEHVRLSAAGTAERDEAVAALLARPFDLEAGPLCRSALIETGHGHFLLLQAHAVLLTVGGLLAAVDGIAAACAGSPADPARTDALEEPPAGPNGVEEARRWWSRRDAAPAELQLPGKAGGSREQGRVLSHDFIVAADTAHRLRRLAEGRQADLAVILLAAVATLACRWSGQEALTIGCDPLIFSGHEGTGEGARAGPGEPLPLPLGGLAAGLFAERVRRARQAIGDWLSDPQPEPAALYRALRAATPLFEMTFDHRAEERASWEAGPMVLTLENVPPVLAPGCSIGIAFREDGAGLKGRVCYRPEIYEPAIVEAFEGQLQCLLDAVAANPGVAPDSLSLLSDEERATLLEQWNDTAHHYSRDVTVHGLVRRAAEARPADVAAMFENNALTYAELEAQSDVVAQRLRDAGIGPGGIVGLCMERSLHLIVGLLGILKAGAAYLPLDPAYPAERLAFMVDDAGAQIVVTSESSRAHLPAAVRRLDVHLSEAPPAQPAPSSQAARSDRAEASDPAYVIYTSGSTGQPKGVVTSHRSLVNRLLWMKAEYDVAADDRILQKTSFSFDVSVWEFLLPLISGARLVLARPGGQRDPDYLLEAMERFGVTILHFVPSALHAFLRGTSGRLPPSVRLVIASGEALPAKLACDFLQRSGGRLENLYGPTEAAIDVTSHSVTPEVREPVPIGRPIWNTRLYVLDAKGRPMPIGVPGELYIAGEGLALRYLNRPELTASRFVPDPFSGGDARMYRTGDVARWNVRGELEYLGRADDQVKVNGFRVELGEIAAVAERHPDVGQAAALVAGERDSRRIVLFLMRSRLGAALDAAGMRAFLSMSLPPHMVPGEVALFDELPLNANGKLDRARLAGLHRAQGVRGPGREPLPEASVAALLADLSAEWNRIFGAAAGTVVSDDIFERGATSLDALALASLVRERYGVPVALSDLYAAPRLAELARLIGRRGGDAPRAGGGDAAGQALVSEGWI